MKVTYVLISLFLFTQFITGQKRIRKTISSPENQSIQIATENCFQVVLETSKEKVLKVEAAIEGEYEKDLAVKIEEDGLNVLVSADFLPNFKAPNDKLSAHKIISISLKVSIPENCTVNVFGTNSKVLASGKYRKLKISLATGDCTLNSVTEIVEVKTQKGTINVITNEGKINAKSVYGVVNLAKIPEGNTSYNLASVEGNINLIKTE